MDSFAALGIDHVAFLRWLFLALGAWYLWLAVSGLVRGATPDWGGALKVDPPGKLWDRDSEPGRFWPLTLMYFALAAAGLGLFAGLGQ